MKTIAFTKYQGTGNDFILIDNRTLKFPKDKSDIIAYLCHRRYGIGSDGIILIQDHPDLDFEMVFFNPDGSQSFCGNGSRCAAAFARSLEITGNTALFLAIDGPHEATILDEQHVRVKMADSSLPVEMLNGEYINTGSPHYVQYVSDINNFNVFKEGKAIREQSDVFGKEGSNVNFIEELARGRIFVRTFERGVEDETLSCGTGVTASAICYGLTNHLFSVEIHTPGGQLTVDFEHEEESKLRNIYLTGPVKRVFDGIATIPEDLL